MVVRVQGSKVIRLGAKGKAKDVIIVNNILEDIYILNTPVIVLFLLGQHFAMHALLQCTIIQNLTFAVILITRLQYHTSNIIQKVVQDVKCLKKDTMVLR
jgi:hypothetical protein